jgi:hypothetical protein
VPVTVAQVPLLGQHVAHRAGFQRRQFLSIESGTDIREHLRFRSPRRDQFGSHQDPDILASCLEAGGVGYVVKMFMAADLIPAMDAALAGGLFVSSM